MVPDPSGAPLRPSRLHLGVRPKELTENASIRSLDSVSAEPSCIGFEVPMPHLSLEGKASSWFWPTSQRQVLAEQPMYPKSPSRNGSALRRLAFDPLLNGSPTLQKPLDSAPIGESCRARSEPPGVLSAQSVNGGNLQ